MKKVLTISFPIMLFAFIAISLHFGFMTRFEDWVYMASVSHMSPTLTEVVKIITHFGDAIAVITICLFLFVIPNLRKHYAMPVAATLIVAETLNLVLKYIFTRSRPDVLRLVAETSYSFPSGHSMASAALYGCIALTAWQKIKNNKSKKIAVTVLCCLMAILIGLSRVYLGVHYITDVIGGWCLGFTVAVIVTQKMGANATTDN